MGVTDKFIHDYFANKTMQASLLTSLNDLAVMIGDQEGGKKVEITRLSGIIDYYTAVEAFRGCTGPTPAAGCAQLASTKATVTAERDVLVGYLSTNLTSFEGFISEKTTNLTNVESNMTALVASMVASDA